MNEADKERYKREKDAYDRGVGVVTTVRIAPPPAPAQEAGTVQCIRVGCTNPSVRNVEWEDEYCSNQCVVLHCDQVFNDWVREQKKNLV